MIQACSSQEFSHRSIESLIIHFFHEYPDIIQYYMEMLYACWSNQILRDQIKSELLNFNQILTINTSMEIEWEILLIIRNNFLNTRRNWKAKSKIAYSRKKELREKNEELLWETFITSAY